MENSSKKAIAGVHSRAEMETSEGAFCPAHEAIQLLQEKWTMHIVRVLLDGPQGFNELGRAVGGCNAATLKTRLDHLEELGLVRRTVHSYMPPRTSYELGAAGFDLQRVIQEIDAWARKHLPSEPESSVAALSATAAS